MQQKTETTYLSWCYEGVNKYKDSYPVLLLKQAENWNNYFAKNDGILARTARWVVSELAMSCGSFEILKKYDRRATICLDCYSFKFQL